LAFSKLGRKPIQVAQVDVVSLVEAAIAECKADNPERSVDVTVADLPSAQGDVAMLRQVWINLVSNAFKYSRSRELAVIRITGETVGDELVYQITDNGVGFDMAHAGQLFGVFQRLHAAKEFEGTGVGLALVHRIVERHGGRIWAVGRVDAGATFYVALPREARVGSPIGRVAAESAKVPPGMR
jgi:light-regulated signal transduction histidine kinase (bacteriophytochrome)